MLLWKKSWCGILLGSQIIPNIQNSAAIKLNCSIRTLFVSLSYIKNHEEVKINVSFSIKYFPQINHQTADSHDRENGYNVICITTNVFPMYWNINKNVAKTRSRGSSSTGPCGTLHLTKGFSKKELFCTSWWVLSNRTISSPLRKTEFSRQLKKTLWSSVSNITQMLDEDPQQFTNHLLSLWVQF